MKERKLHNNTQMSNRLTKEWTTTLEEAFGENGSRGNEGELIACSILDNLNIAYTHHPADQSIQVSGIDIYIGQYGVDVKANLHSNKMCVAVEWPKLKKSKAKWWMHVDRENPDHFIIYEVMSMIKYIHENSIQPVGRDQLCWIDQDAAATL